MTILYRDYAGVPSFPADHKYVSDYTESSILRVMPQTTGQDITPSMGSAYLG